MIALFWAIFVLFCGGGGGGGLALILLVLLGHQETQIVLKFSAIPLAPRVEKPIQTQLDIQ